MRADMHIHRYMYVWLIAFIRTHSDWCSGLSKLMEACHTAPAHGCMHVRSDPFASSEFSTHMLTETGVDHRVEKACYELHLPLVLQQRVSRFS